MTGTKALEVWCRRVTEGYSNVNILNMTTSWRSGLGFCAIIHHFCPHLIDFDSLDPDDVFGNNSLAFSTAEQHLGIPSLLDPHDMVECELLDRLSILTYLSQYYQVLTNQSNSVINVAANPVILQSVERNGKPGHGDQCHICGKSVYLLERLNVGGRIIHRTCFKCARCEEQLTLASFYETETGQFCCEVCPDEEDSQRKRTLKVRKDFEMMLEEEAEQADHSEVEDTVEEVEAKDESEHSMNISDNRKIDDEKVEGSDEDPDSSNENIEVQITFEGEESENIEVEAVENVETESVNHEDDVDSNKTGVLRKESYPADSNPFGSDPEPSNEDTNTSVTNIGESSNPFGSDLDSDEEENEKEEERSSNFSSVQNISSSSKNVSSQNPFGSDFSEDEAPSISRPIPASPSLSISSSVLGHRKKRPAPKPPTPRTPVAAPRPSVENIKSKKDADNINRKNELLSISASKEVDKIPQDKADEGQWRRKKGPAPPRPLPPKRSVKKLPRKAINQELFDIEVKQVGLEKQGVKLEKSIREICATNDAVEGADRDSLGPEAEDLIIQLFDLVNEKNELFRRQTELIYMKKENRLEELHADLEYQIRVLMSKPESQRTAEDQASEEKLIAKLVEVVSQRNFIVDCLEMDRRRELDEDTAIEDHMSSYAAVKPEEKNQIALMKMLKRRKKKKKNKDDEKDVDTSEMKGNEEEKQKKKSAKKKLVSLTTKKLNSLNLSLKKQ